MIRKKVIKERTAYVDPRYHNKLLGKFINYVMLHGNRAKSEIIVYSALDILSSRTSIDGDCAFQKAVNNVRPIVEIKARRIGGSTYQIPIELRYSRSISLALKWLIHSARVRKDSNSMANKLCNELFDALRKRGLTFKKKENIHKMAEANKAFSHYRW